MSKAIRNILTGVIFIVVGLWFGFSGKNVMRVHSSSSGWTKTPAIVEELKLLEHLKNGAVQYYSIVISYRYQFDGKVFRSSRFNPGDHATFDSKESLQRVYGPIKKAAESNTPIEILVNPQAPQEAIVKRDFPTNRENDFFGGILIALFGAGFALHSYFQRE